MTDRCQRLLAVALYAVALSAVLVAVEGPPQNPPPPTTTAPPKTEKTAPEKAAPEKAAPKGPVSDMNWTALRNDAKQSWEEKFITVPVLGKVNAYVSKKPTNNVVFMISGDGQWRLGVIDMSRRIAGAPGGAVVIGLSYVGLRRGQGDTCWDMAGVLDQIAHAAETELKLPAYHAPILVGYSSGATLVYGALAQGRAGQFGGGMSLGFCPDLPSNVNACGVGDWKPTYVLKKGAAMLPETTDVKADWYALHGVEDAECPPAETEKFMSVIAHAHYVPVPHTGHGFGNEPRWGPPFDESIKKLFAAREGK